jgi:hypothetical protein
MLKKKKEFVIELWLGRGFLLAKPENFNQLKNRLPRILKQ